MPHDPAKRLRQMVKGVHYVSLGTGEPTLRSKRGHILSGQIETIIQERAWHWSLSMAVSDGQRSEVTEVVPEQSLTVPELNELIIATSWAAQKEFGDTANTVRWTATITG